MDKEKILNLFDDNIVLSNKEIKEQLNIQNGAVLNTELKRLCDNQEIIRVGQGIYTRIRKTKWGNIIPNESNIVNAFYLKDNNGYVTDAAYLNKIGISTLIPLKKVVVTNRNCYKLNNTSNYIFKKPKIKITGENILYLQFLDGIQCYFDNHVDVENPENIFIKLLDDFNLDKALLIIIARKYYSKKVLNYILDIEEKFYDEFT